MRCTTIAIALVIAMLSVVAFSTSNSSATTTTIIQNHVSAISMNNTTNPSNGQILVIIIWLALMITFAIIGLTRMKWSVISGFIWISGGVLTFTPMQTVLGMIIIVVGFMFCMVGAFGFVKKR